MPVRAYAKPGGGRGRSQERHDHRLYDGPSRARDAVERHDHEVEHEDEQEPRQDVLERLLRIASSPQSPAKASRIDVEASSQASRAMSVTPRA